MSKVQAQTKSVKQLLTGGKFGIDFYQREYEWHRRHVEELLNDLEGRFFANFSSEHERYQVSAYQHYFLGTIITIAESGKRFIVDGQQRLTTLTLLLIYIHHLRKRNLSVVDVAPLIFSEVFSVKSFNIAVPEREDCMKALYERNTFDATNHADLSVRNLVERYDELEELFPESLKGKVLPYFVDWLIECVDLVEIEAQTDDDAFTIFETMNDRGVNLSQADMLKGYLLANINSADPGTMYKLKSQANNEWRRAIRDLVDLENDADEEFFKTWLRAKYAAETRERKKGAINQDFELINKFHRWTRDNRIRIGLDTSQDFYDFITRKLNYFGRYYLEMRRAAHMLTAGREPLYYNAYNNFTLQYMLALAPLTLADDDLRAWEKIQLVTIFADIFLARRMVNYRRNGYSTLQYTMFNLTKEIRDRDIESLREILLKTLDEMDDSFSGVMGDHYGPYALNSFSGRSIRYLLARMTAWVEQQCGKRSNFLTYTTSQNGTPFEIEHIWANHFQRHSDEFSSELDFQEHRNYLGGLVLLPRGDNQSYKDMPYEDKVEHYPKQNLLTASLHPLTYENSPKFTNFVKRSGIPFKPHEHFKKEDLMERQELYRQICEQIWSPDRLNAI